MVNPCSTLGIVLRVVLWQLSIHFMLVDPVTQKSVVPRWKGTFQAGTNPSRSTFSLSSVAEPPTQTQQASASLDN